MMRIRPSKPMAVFGALVGVAMLVVGLTSMSKADDPPVPFMVLWVVVLLGIVGFNLWAAFARGGHTYSITDDRP